MFNSVKESGGIFGQVDEYLFGEEAKPPRERDILTQQANQLLAEAGPLRKALMGRSRDFVTGGMDLSFSPQFQAAKAINAQALLRARKNIMENSPSGGALIQALADADTQNAIALTAAGGDIASQEMDRAMQLGLGGTGLAANMFTSAGELANQIIIQRDQRRIQRESQWQSMWNNIGSFWGTVGMGGGGKSAAGGGGGGGGGATGYRWEYADEQGGA